MQNMLKQPLTNIDYLQTVLAKAGVAPKRSLGQNFLISPEVVEATVDTVATGPATVTELGAGLGTLTQALIAKGITVRAIEKDDVLVDILRTHAPEADIIHDDLKNVAWPWDQPYQLIGNIPYNLTGLIIRRLTQLNPIPTQAIFLVQQEVAERLLAQPPHMSLISLAVQLWGRGERLLTVPKNCFWPEPQVSSTLILLIPGTPPTPEREAILQLAKVCFQGKRKQIAGSLKRSGLYTPKAIESALKSAAIDPQTRPQELSAEEWRQLYTNLAVV